MEVEVHGMRTVLCLMLVFILSRGGDQKLPSVMLRQLHLAAVMLQPVLLLLAAAGMAVLTAQCARKATTVRATVVMHARVAPSQ
jgi:hypothetical protein